MGRIGETLKRARELREIDLREISDATKINIRYLTAIETNQFGLLPGGVFNKGFIRAYANYIGLDGQAMVDNYVHDLEAGPDDPAGHDPVPSGLHRPTEIPQRRAPLSNSGRDTTETGTAVPVESASSHVPASIHLTGLHEISADRGDAPPHAGEEKVLPRIAWLMAATGLLFCILVAWRYVAGTPDAPVDAEQARRPQTSSAGAPAVTPAPDIDAGVDTLPAGDVATAIEGEAPSTGREGAVPVPPAAEPRIAAMTPAADETTAAGRTPPVADGADDPPASDSRGTVDDRPVPLPKPDSLAVGEVDRGMTMVITARAATRVRVICDGREAADRRMSRGEVASLRCERLIRLSAPDASSIRLAINGSDCEPLGAPGSRLFGFVIRADDYRTLCPDRREGTDVTR